MRYRRRELEEEMRFHREQLQAEGLTAAEAERAFGNEWRLQEQSRAMWGWVWLEQLGRDLRQAGRQVRRGPGFATAAIAVLALGIGVTTALFSVFSAVLVHPLPYVHPEQLVMLDGVSPLTFQVVKNDVEQSYRPWVSQAIPGVQSVGFYFPGEAKFAFEPATGLPPSQLRAAEISPGFLGMLGTKLLGHGLTGESSQPGRDHVVILSSGLARAWGTPAGALGRSVSINGVPYRVVGVAPPGFGFPEDGQAATQAWMPLPQPWRFSQDPLATNVFGLNTVARMQPGVSTGELERRLAQDGRLAESGKSRVTATALQAAFTREAATGLWLLLAAVGLLLLIACANVANMQVMRVLQRTQEFKLRAALGAGRSRLVRQVLAESLALVAPAAVLGCLAAAACLPGLRALIPAGLNLAAPIALDGRVLVFAIGVTMLCLLLAGLAPALNLWRRSPRRKTGFEWRQALCIFEVALATILLTGAGLLLQSLGRLSRVNLGFEPGHVLTAKLSLSGPSYGSAAKRLAFCEQLQQRLAALPEVTATALGTNLPLSTGDTFQFSVQTGGRRAAPFYTTVTPGYFKALNIRLLAGRDFESADRQGAPPVVIVSQSLAQALWPNRSPVGQVLPNSWFKSSPPWQVIGEVADTRLTISTPAQNLYLPLSQSPQRAVAVVVRTQGDANRLIPALRGIVTALDATEPLAEVASMSGLVHEALAPSRFRATLIALFAGLALALSVAGLATALAFASALRRGEFGVRIALGASPAAVVWLMLKQGMWITGVGLTVGLTASLGLGRWMQSLLYGISARDGATLVMAAAALSAASLAAMWWPAQRAGRVNPAGTLRRL